LQIKSGSWPHLVKQGRVDKVRQNILGLRHFW
jgi:hypothetical protein